MEASERRKYFKHCARKTLLSDWVNQICAFFITGVCMAGISYLGYAIQDLLFNIGVESEGIYLFPALYMILSWFVIVPLMLGVFNFECRVVAGEEASVRDVFYAFSCERELSRAYKIFIGFILKSLPGFIPSIILWFFIYHLYPYGHLRPFIVFETDIVYLALNAIFVLAVFIGIVYASKNLVGVYYAVKSDNEDVSACFIMGSVASHSSRFEITVLALSFLPLFAVSFFTFGFLFIVYTLPYFVLSFVYMSDYLYNKTCADKQAQEMFFQLFEDTLEYDGEDFDSDELLMQNSDKISECQDNSCSLSDSGNADLTDKSDDTDKADNPNNADNADNKDTCQDFPDGAVNE